MTKMTPNNEIVNKFKENEEKNEEIINGLKKLIIDDNKCVSFQLFYNLNTILIELILITDFIHLCEPQI